jgi:hypothetical protein
MIATSQESLLFVIMKTIDKNQFLQCLNVLPYFQNGLPTTIWVKVYLGGTAKKYPPQKPHFN